MGDVKVEAAIAHWAPRYIENGVRIGDFLEVTGSIDSWDEWCAAWSARAAVHEAEGDKAAAAGHAHSAAFAYNTAAVCYHFAKFLFTHDLHQMREAHMKAVAAHRKAHPFMDPPAERIEFPYLDSHQLVGNLRKPTGVDRPPIVLMLPGLDSAKEELSTNEDLFLQRGMATFTIDGPGQGESEYDSPINPEYEHAAKAAIDALTERGDTDVHRLGAWGVSLGGYYVMRAAAFEKRIKAAISLSGPFKVTDEMWHQLPPMSREAWRVRTHTQDYDATLIEAKKLDLTDVAQLITCPVYVMGGDQDRIVPPESAQEMADGVSGPVTLNVVKGGNHVSSNKAYLYRPQAADWMAEHLGI